MTVLALLAALILEQVRPLNDRSVLSKWMYSAIDGLEDLLNAGDHHHGVAAWWLITIPVLAAALLIYYLLAHLSLALAWAANVGVLYLTMGFRQFSHHFTHVQGALSRGDVMEARRLLKVWRGRPTDDLNSGEVARLAIEEALVASYRHVFGVMFWFVLLPGPSGAILYRLALSLKGRWGEKLGPEHGRFGTFALEAAKWIDWVPLRLTAMAFAVVGNFEDAVYCWRNQAGRWRDSEAGIVLAAGAGAIGVKLGNPVREGFSSAGPALDERIEIGTGEDADAAFLSSTVGLVWRALVLWMLLLAMFEVATWVS